ncbi:unnamed protein product [Adineta steineri]|uniref:Uncharacterized protein n=1 Tax=Adineta steineri TaxID=433720 RepID=A0A814SFF7_9BILA|nr:unnamed protein product [Adineta steineri]
MNPKAVFQWIHRKVSNYNLFMLEENDYDDDDDDDGDGSIRDPAITLKYQKYKTWLYVILLIVCLYVLFYVTLIKKESKTVVIKNITPDIFNKLYLEHGQSLSCPCSTVMIPYENFVSNNVTMHPICSSVFIGKQWIDGLYFIDAKPLGPWDFRKTAFSQFNLLSKFCSLSQEINSQTQIDIDHTDFFAVELLSEAQVQKEINGVIEFEKISASSRMMTFVNYIRTTIQGNYLVSALGTNWIITTYYNLSGYYYISGVQVDQPASGFSSIFCSRTVILIAATLSESSNESISFYNLEEMNLMDNSTIVNGFLVGCTPLEAIFQSTLDCLYELECLQLLFDYFPNLNQLNFTANNSILSSEHDNTTVINYLSRLFINNWSSKINYSEYFNQCSPSMCTYTITDRTDLSYAITLFISLYGGLIIILRLVASYFINILSKFTNRSDHQNTNALTLIESIKRLNLFKNINDRTEDSIKQQRITTRVYLILLFGSICILCLFTSLNSEIVLITVSSPSLATYNSLEIADSDTLRCPCSNKTIPYQTFVSTSLRFHQICTSDFVDDDWIQIVRNNIGYNTNNDWRNDAGGEFQTLSDFCRLANKTIDDATDRFLSQFFIASSVMNEIDFNRQLYAILNQFHQSTLYNFNLVKDLAQFILQVDQLYRGSTAGFIIYGYEDLVINFITNETNNDTTVQGQFILKEFQDINSTMTTCVCAINPYCQNPAFIQFDYTDLSSIYDIPGWKQGCSRIDSLQLSTLECLYPDSTSDCFPTLMSTMGKLSYYSWFLTSLTLHIEPLIYDPTVSRYPPDTPMSSIFNEMMLEQWNSSASYKIFYESCAPTYCSYSQRIHKQTFIGIIVTFVSLIGGIVVSLRLVTPHAVKFILKFLTKSKKKPKQTTQVRGSCLDRLKMLIQSLIKLLPTKLIELNIFISRDIGSDVNQVKAKIYGQWATRLYMILFISSLTILIFYTAIQPKALIKNFDQPSFTYYNHLKEVYGVDLKCTCSNIASAYNQFVEIQPVFHSICSSHFVSEEWRVDLTNGLVSNLSVYKQNDYRRFLSAHLQYLRGLCQFSVQSVNNSINGFLTSLLITNELLSNSSFYDRLDLLTEQSKSNAPILLSRLLSLIRDINHGNAFISIYGTNFIYTPMVLEVFYGYTPTEPIIYDNDCSCGLFPNCTTQATFIETNSSIKMSVRGMKIGCIPSESLLASTLECFYDQSCLDLIQHYTNYRNSSIPLLTTTTRFTSNTTVDELKNNLFIERWSTQINYSSYYEQCLPSVCSYTSIEKFNLLYTITVILGLQGGLTIVLKWICPKLVRIGSKIYHRRKRQISSNQVSPNSTTTNPPLHDSFNTTLSTTKTISSSTSEPICQFHFERVMIDTQCLETNLVASVLIDFNDDKQMDLILYCDYTQTIDILLGNGNATFREMCKISLRMNSSVVLIRVADMDNDSRLDLIILYENDWSSYEIVILFGSGFGSAPKQLGIADFNNDNYLDIAVLNDGSLHIHVFLSNGSKGFQPQKRFFTAYDIESFDMVVGDFDNDNQSDIVVIHELINTVCMLYQFNNGTFNVNKQIVTDYPVALDIIAIGDLNGDNYLDLIIGSISPYKTYGFLGNRNGNFQSQIIDSSALEISKRWIGASDFNNDNCQDIISMDDTSGTINILLNTCGCSRN